MFIRDTCYQCLYHECIKVLASREKAKHINKIPQIHTPHMSWRVSDELVHILQTDVQFSIIIVVLQTIPSNPYVSPFSYYNTHNCTDSHTSQTLLSHLPGLPILQHLPRFPHLPKFAKDCQDYKNCHTTPTPSAFLKTATHISQDCYDFYK